MNSNVREYVQKLSDEITSQISEVTQSLKSQVICDAVEALYEKRKTKQ